MASTAAACKRLQVQPFNRSSPLARPIDRRLHVINNHDVMSQRAYFLGTLTP